MKPIKRWENLSLRLKLLIMVCTIVFVPLVFSNILLYRDAIDAYKSISLHAGEISLERASSLVEAEISRAMRISETIAADQRINEILLHMYEEYSDEIRLDDIRELSKSFSKFASESGVVTIRFVYPMQVKWLSNNREISIPLEEFSALILENNRDEDPLALPGPVWLPHSTLQSYDAGYQYQAVVYARTLRNIHNFDMLLGLVLVIQDPSVYRSALNQASYDDDSLLVLNDMNGQLIAYIGGGENAEKMLESLEKNGSTTKDSLILQKTIPGTGWSISVVTADTVYKNRILGTTLQTILLIVALTVFSILMAGWLTRPLIKRVRRLLHSMNAVEKEDLTVVIPSPNNDELGIIEKHYNQMLFELDALLQRTKDMSRNEQLQNIRLLQTQINPHFLYNTLNSILWTARDYNADKVCEMLMALSDFYKIGLHLGRVEATLKDELQHVRRYIALQNLRNVQIITLDINVQESSLFDLRLPNLLLQPIVENSIIHGFIGRSQGHILINVSKMDKFAQIEIIDDGIGMKPEVFDQIGKKSNIDRAYGLYNIRERLQLRYGDGSSFIMGDTGGIGTSIVIRVLIEEKSPKMNNGE